MVTIFYINKDFYVEQILFGNSKEDQVRLLMVAYLLQAIVFKQL